MDLWVTWFKDATNAASLVYQRADGKTQITDTPTSIISQTSSDNNHAPLATPSNSALPIVYEERQQPTQHDTQSGHMTRIELSSKRYATFSFPDSLTAKDAQRLKGALSGLAAIIDSMIEESS